MDAGKPAIGHSEEDKEEIIAGSPVDAWSRHDRPQRRRGEARQGGGFLIIQ
jgi:hypothetical protein